MDTDGKLIRLNNRFPEFYQVLRELANEEKGRSGSGFCTGVRVARRILVTGECEGFTWRHA